MIDRTSQTKQWCWRRVDGNYTSDWMTAEEVQGMILHSIISVKDTEATNASNMFCKDMPFRVYWLPIKDIPELYPPEMLYTLKCVAPQMEWLHEAYEMRIPQ